MATLVGRDPATFSPVERYLCDAILAGVDPDDAIEHFTAAHDALDREMMTYWWESLWARPSQRLPVGEWDTWMIRAGRGYGKTRTASEGIRKLVGRGMARAVTIIGATAADARDVMIEGPESGLLAVHPPEFRPAYEPSKRLLTWPNGALGHVRSAEDPDSVRGLNSELVWGDEPASWRHGEATWDNAMLGNRLGRPHSILSGTPRPLPWLRKIEERPGTRLSTGSTYENVGNLAKQFIALILERYEGTRLGAQELHARYLEDVEGALWRMAVLEATRFLKWDGTNPWASLTANITPESRTLLNLGPWVISPGERRRWVTWVGVDPPGETAECGIIVGTAPEQGKGGRDHAVILDDMSIAGPPEVWGPRVVEAIRKWDALGAVVETNQGGDMCRATIHNVDPSVKVVKVRAKDSKTDRAEPVSALYGRGWVHHYGHFAKLEEQQTTWVQAEDKSPDRLDGLVHLVTHLLTPINVGTATLHRPR